MNALSSMLKVTVQRNGKKYEQEYSIGKPLYSVREIGLSDEHGTEVHFKPDLSIFTVGEYNYDTLASRMRELSFLNKGVSITLCDERTANEDGSFPVETFHSEGGLREFVEYLDANREKLSDKVIYMEGERNGMPVEVAMQYNLSFSENLHSYVNNINTHEGGTHVAGFRRGLTRTLKTYAEKRDCFPR